MRRPVETTRPPGRILRNGVLCCGLCDGRAQVDTADLRSWRPSRSHGVVHARCLAELRRRLRAWHSYMATLKRDRRGRFRARRIKMQDPGAGVDIIALIAPPPAGCSQPETVVASAFSPAEDVPGREMYEYAAGSGRVNARRPVHTHALPRRVGDLLEALQLPSAPSPVKRSRSLVRHATHGVGRVLETGPRAALVRWGDPGPADRWAERWTPLRELSAET